MSSDTSYEMIKETGQSDHNPLPKKENKMTRRRILIIYEDLLNRYKQYIEGKVVEFPLEDLPGFITFHLPPIHGRADDEVKFKGVFIPCDEHEGTVIATMYGDSWSYPAHLLDVATDEEIRHLVSEMLFVDGNSASDFLEAQGF